MESGKKRMPTQDRKSSHKKEKWVKNAGGKKKKNIKQEKIKLKQLKEHKGQENKKRHVSQIEKKSSKHRGTGSRPRRKEGRKTQNQSECK